MHLAVILMLVILDFVILTLKAEGSSGCLHHRHPEPFKGEGSSNVLYMKYNWMLRCAQHDEMRECMQGKKHKRTSGGVQPEVRGMGLGVPLN